MKTTSAKFVKSAMDPDQFPKDRKPEIAFAGRSNAGKSSLLNTLLGKKGLAKTSGSPGKTQTVNFFDVNEKIYFVDLPGYGFARVPKNVKANWNRVMFSYLREREPLRLVAALLDARHKPSEKDLEMLDLLDEAEVPTLVVATKIDKVKRSQRTKNIDVIRNTLELAQDAVILPFSSVTGEGVQMLWEIFEDHI